MATPSANEIATLVDEIRNLNQALDETLVDRTEISRRYDAALNGLLNAAHEFDPALWTALPPDRQASRAIELARLKQILENAVAAAEPVVRIPQDSFMYKKEASNLAILFLTILAVVGLGYNLYLIRCNWTKATTGEKEAVSTPTPTPSPSNSRLTAGTPLSNPSPSPTSVIGTPTATPVASNAETASTKTQTETIPASGKNLKPTEGDVLYMVILLGSLGGFLRLASSLANYVGNRQLLQSWILYYLLTPIQGAALAPLVYLLLRVGVLNPANPAPGTNSPADSLNLIGIYAFAALTGLFSKQAIEMLADVFSTIFKKAETKDALAKSKPDETKAKDKPAAR